MSELEFKKNIVAFLDVLGFKEKIFNATSDKAAQKDLIENYIQRVQAVVAVVAKLKVNNVKIDVISDSIIIYAPYSAGNVKETVARVIHAVALVQCYLAERNYWLRGAVSFGGLIKQSEILIGDGLVNAYQIEDEFAIYPRVIIDPRIFKFFDSQENFMREVNGSDFGMWKGSLVFKNSRGGWGGADFQDDKLVFVNFFNFFMIDGPKFEMLDRVLANLKKNIYNKPDIYKKFLWVKEYFLAAVDVALKDALFDQTPGIDEGGGGEKVKQVRKKIDEI